MQLLFTLTIVYSVISLGLILFGTGIGFLLHWMFSPVDLGTGILVGVVTTVSSIHFLIRFMSFLDAFEADQEEQEDDLGRPIVTYPFSPIPSRRNRRRKRK